MVTCARVRVLHVDVLVVGRVGVRAADDDDEDEEEGQAEEDNEDGGQKAAAEATEIVAGLHGHLHKKVIDWLFRNFDCSKSNDCA